MTERAIGPLPVRSVAVDYDLWWCAQVRAALPHWVRGTRKAGFTDGHAYWPMGSRAMNERLEHRLQHLAELRAHG